MQTPISTRPCLLLIPFLFLNLQCQKEKAVSKPPLPSVHPIVGQWEWQYGIDYYQDTFTPVSTGGKEILNFLANDSVEIHFARPSFVADTVHPYWFEMSIGSSVPDSTIFLMINDSPYLYEISNDTLITDTRLGGDMGVWMLYTRQNSL